MSDDHIRALNSKRQIPVAISGYYVATDPGGARDVGLHLDIVDGQLGATLNAQLVVHLSPDGAREVAAALLRKADAAEAGLPQA